MNKAEDPRGAILTTDQIDPEKLDAFLTASFGPMKGEFLRSHGDWWHGGSENRWVILVGEEIAGYCAVIQTKIRLHGEEVPAIWWVDLVIAPPFRGKGLQSLFDIKIRAIADLKLGFPNELAAIIHRKHGWGIKDDFKVVLLPLNPAKMKRVRQSRGAVGLLLKLAGFAFSSMFSGMRWSLKRYRPKWSRRVNDPDPGLLAGVFFRDQNKNTHTTWRDAAYFQHRFFDAPYANELHFYTAGPVEKPTHFMITRETHIEGIRAARILDLFGDFTDKARIKDLVSCGVKDTVASGTSQIICLATDPLLGRALLEVGFLTVSKTRFCWHSEHASTLAALEHPGYWTLADSDNDAPE